MKVLLNLSMIGRQIMATTAWDKKPISLRGMIFLFFIANIL